MNRTNLKTRHKASPEIPTDLGADAIRDVCAGLNRILADTFALYMKTKNFHWHMSGPHFRDYHLLLDEQAAQIWIDEAERRAWFLLESTRQDA